MRVFMIAASILILSALILPFASPATAAITFADGFESGDMGAWITVNGDDRGSVGDPGADRSSDRGGHRDAVPVGITGERHPLERIADCLTHRTESLKGTS